MSRPDHHSTIDILFLLDFDSQTLDDTLLPPMDIDILILRLFDFMLCYWDIDTYIIRLYDDSL